MKTRSRAKTTRARRKLTSDGSREEEIGFDQLIPGLDEETSGIECGGGPVDK